MKFQASKAHSPFALLAVASLSLVSGFAAAATKVNINPEQRGQPERKEEKPAFHRKLWTGSFDRAADQSGAVAKQLEGGLEFNCQEQFGFKPARGTTAARPANWAALHDCRDREEASKNFGKQAKSIEKQQKVMSVVSKASDVAAVAAVGGVVYSELAVKKQNQAGTFESAANIQRIAGQASYVTGATDLTLGAYAFVAQKRKLEEMQRTLNGKGASTDNNQLNSSLTNAVEATKKAAYNHMMYGAGKMAAGYASMWLAKRTEKQAENMKTVQELQDLIAIENAKRAGMVPPTVAATWPAGASPPAPFIQNNQPTFTMPNSGSGSGLAPVPTSGVSYSIPSGGASIAPPAGRSLAAAGGAAKNSGLSGGGGGAGGDSSGASAPPPDAEVDVKAHKDALGSFETSLTGGMRSFSGTPGEAPKEEIPNLAAMMGGQDGAHVATGLSPNQMISAALEGTEGMEQGSMAGVNGKSETSLFLITKEKLNKMFQVGNIGVPKDLEVKN